MFDDFVNRFYYFSMKIYQGAFFYKLYNIDIEFLILCLKDKFPFDLKYEFVSASRSENLYSDESILLAVSMLCGVEVKTLEDAGTSLSVFKKNRKKQYNLMKAKESYLRKKSVK